MPIYIEYGLDFDNNKFGFGKSVEIENADGSEYRTKVSVKLKNKRYYLRFWFLKKVFIFSRDGFETVKKSRHNLKIVFGIKRKKENDENNL